MSLADYQGFALITGASSGIGREFARQIAAQGVPCVLVARRAERLQELQSELSARHAVDVRCIVQDLTAEDCVDRVLEATKDIPIGILVNNAGFGNSGPFATRDPKRIAEMIKLNCLTPALMTRAYLPPMLERGRGAIIVVSSALGLTPCPYETVYGATKAFDLFLGGGLWGELKGSGVDAITICPAATLTEFQDVDGYRPEQAEKIKKISAPADYIAQITLRNLGRKPVVIAREGKLLNVASRVMPRRAALAVMAREMKKRAPEG